jgi:hypothetical protein
MPDRIPEPWLSFVRDVDRALKEAVEVHCLGGFVLTVLCGLPRPTGDLDFIEARPRPAGQELLRVAGDGSALAERHALRFRMVTIAEYPEGYESRLIDVTPAGCHRLSLTAFDVHDVVLAKLSRNSPRDRSDVEYLAARGFLDRRSLEKRFEAELRPYLLNEQRESLTFDLWLTEFFGEKG